MAGMLPSMMKGQNRCGEKLRGTAHEGITQPSKMCAIPHLFSEDIRRICLAGDMVDLQCPVLNPLMNRIFMQLDMASRLQCHIVRPFDTGVIVIVEDRW